MVLCELSGLFSSVLLDLFSVACILEAFITALLYPLNQTALELTLHSVLCEGAL